VIEQAANPASFYVQSLARGLAVIGALDSPEPLSLSDVARRAGLSRAAARRFVLTLEQLGYVRQAGGRFALTPRVLELGSAYLSSLTMPEIALPHIKALVDHVCESAVLSVLDEVSTVGIARVPARRIMTGAIVLGQRLPAWAAASGRVLLANLPDEELESLLARFVFEPLTDRTIVSREQLEAALEVIRAQGWSVVDQELEIGLRALAAPIRDRAGTVVAALTLVTRGASGNVDDLEPLLLPPLLEACAAIERDLAAGDARLGWTASPADLVS
jgi:IclR family transcriptional regulator, pca regulon regulatory protein